MTEENRPSHPEQVVLEIVSRRSGVPLSSLSKDDRLLQDLGVDGDDAVEILLELQRAFRIDMRTFNVQRHFRAEPNLLSFLRRAWGRGPDDKSKVPVRIADLIDAAISGKWVL